MSPEGGVHEKPNDKCAKMCRSYVGSGDVLWKKIPGKTYRGKTTGGCSNPLGCIRVKCSTNVTPEQIVYSFIDFLLTFISCSVIFSLVWPWAAIKFIINSNMGIWDWDKTFITPIRRQYEIEETTVSAQWTLPWQLTNWHSLDPVAIRCLVHIPDKPTYKCKDEKVPTK